jgi:N-acetylglucosamine kinase-like BadF-type ATPase
VEQTLLIAESGGTKTDWRLLWGGEVLAHQGVGLNPSHHPHGQLAERVGASLGPIQDLAQNAQVFFYGAGLESEAPRAAINAALDQALRPLRLELGTDLLAAARAAAGDSPALVCILGTGSNAARYDGNIIVAQRGGHGWLIGDFGSGVDLGRRFLLAALEGKLEASAATAFEVNLGMSPMTFRAAVYADPYPAQRLSSLMPLVVSLRNEPEGAALIAEGFDAFLEHDILPLGGAALPLVCVGSVAHALEVEWRAACLAVGFPEVRFSGDIADRLVSYHRALRP